MYVFTWYRYRYCVTASLQKHLWLAFTFVTFAELYFNPFGVSSLFSPSWPFTSVTPHVFLPVWSFCVCLEIPSGAVTVSGATPDHATAQLAETSRKGSKTVCKQKSALQTGSMPQNASEMWLEPQKGRQLFVSRNAASLTNLMAIWPPHSLPAPEIPLFSLNTVSNYILEYSLAPQQSSYHQVPLIKGMHAL